MASLARWPGLRSARAGLEKDPTAEPTGGEPIPGYRDIRQIGRGGFSVVYRAHQEKFDRIVALKVLSVEFADARVRQGFLRELQLASRLTGHPNIVTVLDSGITGTGRPYIAMEYFERGSLQDLITTTGMLPLADVLPIGVKIAGALGAAHREGILHRDIKPQNVLVSRHGEPALTDFGTARWMAGPEISWRSDAFTPLHAAPEVLQGKAPSVACDIYSLGSTLYQLLAGRPLYQIDEDGIGGLLLRILNEEWPQVVDADLPPAAVDVIRRAMAREPAGRFPDASTFVDALRRLQVGLGLSPAEIAPVQSPPLLEAETVRIGLPSEPKGRRRWPVVVGIVALALAVATGLVFAMVGGRGGKAGPTGPTQVPPPVASAPPSRAQPPLAASPPANSESEQLVPAAPQNLMATPTAAGEVTVTWRAGPANGTPVTGYEIESSSAARMTTPAGQLRAVITGLAAGSQITVTVRARSEAGLGDPATTLAVVASTPSVSITAISSDVTSVTVQFQVDGRGLAIGDCVASVAGAGQARGHCGRLTVGGLMAGSSVRMTVSARTAAGIGSDAADATTDQLKGTVYCNDSSTPDSTACDNGISVYSGPDQTTTRLRSVYDGQRFVAVCKVSGVEVYAYVYNNHKRSTWWIELPGGGYVPYVWFNVDHRDDLSPVRIC